jgi:endonuclease/exonuclease/phosphatase family metal-dependent hydrolase
MKNLNWIDKVIYFFNIIFGLLLFIGYALRYFSPIHFPEIASIGLGLPVLLIINGAFLIYWLIKLKKQVLLSLIIIALGYDVITNMLVLGNRPKSGVESIELMSFNVRHFNIFKWLDKENISQKIEDFVLTESPDIIAFQDFYENADFNIDSDYSYKFVKHRKNQKHNGLAIYSKFPFAKTGSLDFQDTTNNIIYADIVKYDDTIRFYNVHFESLKLKPDVNSIQSQDQKKLIGRIGAAFKKQIQQFHLLQKSLTNVKYPVVIAGDLNNTSYSYLYDQLRKEGFADAFIERGNGYGKTFDFDFIPLRIDVILTDEKLIQVVDFENHSVKLSDHYPVSAKIAF